MLRSFDKSPVHKYMEELRKRKTKVKNFRTIRNKQLLIKQIYEKHKIEKLTFEDRSYIIEENGRITDIINNNIIGNMRSGVLIIDMLRYEENNKYYDLFEIEIAKLKREYEAQQKDFDKTQEELTKLKKEFLSNNETKEKPKEEKKEKPQDINKSFVGNRFRKRFMDDMKKIKLEELEHIKYFEIIKNITSMSIVEPKVYLFDNYLLILGDLELKTQVIKRIDPNYNVEDQFKGYQETYNKIKQKNNNL